MKKLLSLMLVLALGGFTIGCGDPGPAEVPEVNEEEEIEGNMNAADPTAGLEEGGAPADPEGGGEEGGDAAP